jgi:hypothetical protein
MIGNHALLWSKLFSINIHNCGTPNFQYIIHSYKEQEKMKTWPLDPLAFNLSCGILRLVINIVCINKAINTSKVRGNEAPVSYAARFFRRFEHRRTAEEDANAASEEPRNTGCRRKELVLELFRMRWRAKNDLPIEKSNLSRREPTLTPYNEYSFGTANALAFGIILQEDMNQCMNAKAEMKCPNVYCQVQLHQ